MLRVVHPGICRPKKAAYSTAELHVPCTLAGLQSLHYKAFSDHPVLQCAAAILFSLQ